MTEVILDSIYEAVKVGSRNKIYKNIKNAKD